MDNERIKDLLINCLAAIDAQYIEFDTKINILREIGISENELKKLGFDYMNDYLEDYKENE